MSPLYIYSRRVPPKRAPPDPQEIGWLQEEGDLNTWGRSCCSAAVPWPAPLPSIGGAPRHTTARPTGAKVNNKSVVGPTTTTAACQGARPSPQRNEKLPSATTSFALTSLVDYIHNHRIN